MCSEILKMGFSIQQKENATENAFSHQLEDLYSKVNFWMGKAFGACNTS
jgi:hypothetical protein